MPSQNEQNPTHTNDRGECARCGARRSPAEWWGEPHQCSDIVALQGQLEAAEARLRKIASVAVVRGRCVFCAHPEDPADGTHTDTCPVAPESDPCPYTHDSGDRCVLQFEHGGSHGLGY